jgi:uncharacterized protein (TIGR02266 family)
MNRQPSHLRGAPQPRYDGAMPGTEARQHPRARTRVKVEYHFGASTGVGYTNDVSEGGMFLACRETAARGTRVYLRMHLPSAAAGEPLKIIGLVTRVVAATDTGPAGMGIHFEVAYARTREALADFLEALLALDANGAPSLRAPLRISRLPPSHDEPEEDDEPAEPPGRTARAAVIIALILAIAAALMLAVRRIGGA